MLVNIKINDVKKFDFNESQSINKSTLVLKNLYT